MQTMEAKDPKAIRRALLSSLLLIYFLRPSTLFHFQPIHASALITSKQ
jgi:hypothetical protein